MKTELKAGPVIDVDLSKYFLTEVQAVGLRTIMDIEELKKDMFDDEEICKDTEIYG